MKRIIVCLLIVLVPTFVSSEETREIKEYYPSGKIKVIAIYKALEAIDKEPNKPTTLFLFIDSQAAILRIQKGINYYSQLIWKKSTKLAQKSYKI